MTFPIRQILPILTLAATTSLATLPARAGNAAPAGEALAGEWEWSAPDSRQQTRQVERLSIFADGSLIRYSGILPQRLYVIVLHRQPGQWSTGSGGALSLRLATPESTGWTDLKSRRPPTVDPKALVERLSLRVESLDRDSLVLVGPKGRRVFKRMRDDA